MFTWQFFVTISMNDRNKTTHKFFFLVWCIGHSDFLTEICEILVCKLVFRINWHLVIADNLRLTRKCPKSMSDRNKLIPIKFLSNCNLLTQPLMYLYVWNIPRISFRATCSAMTDTWSLEKISGKQANTVGSSMTEVNKFLW